MVQPACCRPCRNTPLRACPSGSSAAKLWRTPMRRTRSPCCARAPSGQAAAVPLRSVMNWRRLMSSMGSSPEPAVPAYRRLRMPWKHPQVLGLDLNRSERAGTRSGCAAAAATPIATNSLSPEVLEPVRGQLGVAHRVLDVFVAEPRLQRPGVVAGIGERVAAAVPQHVRVDRERHFGPLSDSAE